MSAKLTRVYSSTLKYALRGALMASTAAFCVFAVIGPGTVYAQAQQATDAELEEIIVTGSRIKRAAYDNLQPGVSMNSDFIDDRGFANVAEAVNEVPAFGLGVTNEGRQGPVTGGQNFVNAFGLGSQRTLTLINGRRVVPQNSPGVLDDPSGGAIGSNGLQVDLNIIPTAAIERVETIFIGGAPIYGSDAIAGTLNVILKDDYEGFSSEAQYGVDERGTVERSRIRGLFGANTANGRGNVMLAVEYSTVGLLDSRENSIARRQTAFCENPAAGLRPNGIPIVDPSDGIPDLVLCDDAVNLFFAPNSGMPLLPGTFVPGPDGAGALSDAAGDPLVFNADGTLITWDQANLGTPRNQTFSVGADGFNNPVIFTLADRVVLTSPLDRWNLMTISHYDLTDDTRIFFEGLYSRSETSSIPTTIPRFGSNRGAPGANGAMTININDNPFVSQQLRDTLVLNNAFDPNLAEDQFFQLNRSNADIIGPDDRDFRGQDVFRFVTGFEGDLEILGRSWSWDTAFNFGETNSTIRIPAINGPRYALALDAVTDPATGEIVCRAQIDPPGSVFDNGVFVAPPDSAIDDCIPFNPFGIQELTPAQELYLIQRDFQSTKIRQLSYGANIGGELLNLPAGPVSIAAGFQYRREEANFRGDRSTRIGIDPTTPQPDVGGEFDTTEFYGETLIPIVENGVGPGFNVPFLASLQLEAAVRFVDNSRSGNDVTWTAGGRLRPDLPLIEDGLTIRGNFTRSIRAPSVQELFLPRAEIATFASDPCDTEFIDAGPNPAVRRANCEAEVAMLKQQGALAPDFDLVGFESLIAVQSFPASFGGNPDLENEDADSWTVGAVFAPPFLEGFTISADWIDISLSNEIAALSATQLMRACFDSSNFPNVSECGQFQRDDEFQVFDPVTGFRNVAQREFSALVSNFSYTFEASDLFSTIPGNVEIFGSFFHNNKMERVVTEGDLEIFTGEQGFERQRWQLNFRYDRNDRFMFLWQTQYIGSFLVDAQAAPERFVPGQGKAPAVDLHNTTLSYQLTDKIGLRLVVNNVFDERDGRIRQAATLSGSNSGPFQPLDVVGRRYLFAVNAKF